MSTRGLEFKYCRYHGRCIHRLSDDGKTWLCTGKFTNPDGGLHDLPCNNVIKVVPQVPGVTE